MKQIFTLSIVIFLLLMTSCRGNHNNISDNVSSYYNSSYEKEYKDEPGKTETSDVDESKVKSLDNIFVEDPKVTSNYIAENKSSDIQQKAEDNVQKDKSVIQQSNPKEPEKEAVQSEIIYAQKTDAEVIADRVIDYINEYRNQNGVCSATKLLGLTKLAKFRSGQLVTNFSHDTIAIRTAATATKYGEYIDTKLLGMDTEPYYSPHSVEAIAMSGYRGTVDGVAENFATLIKNSSSHWSYVGDEKNIYIGVGLTYAGGNWFMNITVSDTNQYEK